MAFNLMKDVVDYAKKKCQRNKLNMQVQYYDKMER